MCDDRVLYFDPVTTRPTVPPEECLVGRGGGLALHARGYGAGGPGAVPLLEPAGPEPQAQVPPPVRHRAGRHRPQQLLKLPFQLARYPRPKSRTVSKLDVLEVEVFEMFRHHSDRN
jgi:hypothetical protein